MMIHCPMCNSAWIRWARTSWELYEIVDGVPVFHEHISIADPSVGGTVECHDCGQIIVRGHGNAV